MPLFNPSVGTVTVDAEGYITVAGVALPFKYVEEDLGDDTIRIHHLVKHPTLGEIEIGFTDFPVP